jgi:tetratricopeptide (TPR) repeat protein
MTSKAPKEEERLKKSLELLEYYRLLFKNHPRKKYFVPLAEIYRSLECFDEALEILKEGLKYHPEYIIARALLAQTYFQMGYFVQANHEAHKAIESDFENIAALKIYIRSCFKLGLCTPMGKPVADKAKDAIVQLFSILPDDDEAKEWKKGTLNSQPTLLQMPIGKIEDFELKSLTPKNDKKEAIDALNRLLIKINQKSWQKRGQNRGKKGELCQRF